ncbi:MAG TPA: glycosyltransferase family 1 protein [Ramlibacter sp.]|nr:glycosyltransferase family 1 protein [Ramlibacter sp.]
MRVGLGVSVLARGLQSGGVDGIGIYTRELMKRLATRPGLELLPVSWGHPLPPAEDAGRAALREGGFMLPATVSALTGLDFPCSSRFAGRMDLMHATDHLIPRLGKLPVVATIHDAIPLAHPEWLRSRLGRVKSALWRRSALWADHVITVSEFSRREIQRHFGVPAERITTIAQGVDARWFAPMDVEAIAAARARLGLPERFFLCVGTLQPRKNIERAIAAWHSLPAPVRAGTGLVIVGRAGWKCESLVQDLRSGRHGPSVRWLERIADADLLAVVKAATVLLATSLYEGFGLPVLEAFAAGTPVIASKTTSLPEVAGDAALLVDPLDVAAMAGAMERLAGDEALRGDLARRGLARSADYSWDRTAAATFEVYQQVLARR